MGALECHIQNTAGAHNFRIATWRFNSIFSIAFCISEGDPGSLGFYKSYRINSRNNKVDFHQE